MSEFVKLENQYGTGILYISAPNDVNNIADETNLTNLTCSGFIGESQLVPKNTLSENLLNLK